MTSHIWMLEQSAIDDFKRKNRRLHSDTIREWQGRQHPFRVDDVRRLPIRPGHSKRANSKKSYFKYTSFQFFISSEGHLKEMYSVRRWKEKKYYWMVQEEVWGLEKRAQEEVWGLEKRAKDWL